MQALTTTLAAIWEWNPNWTDWITLTRALGPDYGVHAPLSVARVAEANGIDLALWALRCAVDQDVAARIASTFAADCAEHVLPIFERECPYDKRPRNAIAAARNCSAAAAGCALAAVASATDTEDKSARAAADAAACAAICVGALTTPAIEAAAHAAEKARIAGGHNELAWQEQHLIDLLNGEGQ